MRLLLLSLFFCLFGNISLLMASDHWQQRADYGSFGRHRAVAIGIGNKAYCGTGHLNGSGTDSWYPDWWEYDPATNAWTQKTDYPGNNGNGDQDCVAISLNNVAFVGMGQLSGNNFYKYDPQTNVWTQVSSPSLGSSFTNTFPFTIGNKGYFPTLYSTSFFSYDPALDLWTQLNNLPFSTIYGIPTFAINDKGYIKNGADFYEYDATLDSWTPKAQFPGLSPHRPAGIGTSNYGYFIGGFSGSPSVLPWIWAPEVWRYDQANDSWMQLEDFPGSTRRWAVTARVGERLFYGLGTNGTNFNDFWEFSPFAGLEESEAEAFNAFPTPAHDFVNFTSDNYQNFEVVVYDLQGNKVSHISAENGKTTLERGKLTSGLYLYHILADGAIVYSDQLVFN